MSIYSLPKTDVPIKFKRFNRVILAADRGKNKLKKSYGLAIKMIFL